MKKEDIKKLASLSKIKLNDAELDKFTKDMETILSSVETLDSFEHETGCKIKEYNSEEILFNELREDVAMPSMPQKDVLANAPQHENGYFKVSGTTLEEGNS